MSCHSKRELENMMEDVINALDLSPQVIESHGQLGTEPAKLVRMILDQKDFQISALKAGMAMLAAAPEADGKGGEA